MSPIDDELRQALSGRASRVRPATDALVAIEVRARQIRRRRAASAVAGGVLALALAAGVTVPLVVRAGGDDGSAQVARPAVSAAAPANVVDWPVRGQVDQADLAALERDYVPASGTRPAGDPHAKVIAAGKSGTTRYLLAQLWFDGQGVAETATYAVESGAGHYDLKATLEDGSPLATMMVDDATLLVVPNPDVVKVEYAADGTTYAPIGLLVTRVQTGSPQATDQAQQGEQLRYTFAGGQTNTVSVEQTLCGIKECG